MVSLDGSAVAFVVAVAVAGALDRLGFGVGGGRVAVDTTKTVASTIVFARACALASTVASMSGTG